MHIFRNCHYILTSISESHGSPKTYFISFCIGCEYTLLSKIWPKFGFVVDQAQNANHVECLLFVFSAATEICRLRWNWFYLILVSPLLMISYTSILSSFHQFITNPTAQQLNGTGKEDKVKNYCYNVRVLSHCVLIVISLTSIMMQWHCISVYRLRRNWDCQKGFTT